MNDFFNRIKVKYNYSDELIKVLSDIMNVFVVVLGDSYLDIISYVFENVFIYEFENVKDAANYMTSFFNNGEKYNVGSLATGGGFMENNYFIDNDGILKQQIFIGIQKGDYNQSLIQTLIHELCHAISTVNGFKLKNNVLYTESGTSNTSYEFNGRCKGKIVSSNGGFFNELLTENLAMQVMDSYDASTVHEASCYNGWVNAFKNIFRNDHINSIIINDYVNHTNDMSTEISKMFSQEELRSAVDCLYSVVDLSNPILKEYFDSLYNMTVDEFFIKYIEYINSYPKAPVGIDYESFRMMVKINGRIVILLGNELEMKKNL